MSKQATSNRHKHTVKTILKNILHSLSSYFLFWLLLFFFFYLFDWFSLYKYSKLFILSHRRLDTPDWICIFYYFQFHLFLLVTWKEKKSMSFVLLLSLSSCQFPQHTYCTHTRHNFWLFSRLISWCCYCYRFEWLHWLGKTSSFTAFISRTTHSIFFPFYKNQTRLKNFFHACHFFLFIEQISISPDLFISFIIWCADTNKTHRPNFLPTPNFHEKGRGIQSWRARFPIERHNFDMPRVCWQQQKPKLGERTTRLSCSPFLFIFSPLFPHTKAWKSSLTIFARPFLVFWWFLWTFQTTEKTKNSSERKNAQTKTHLLYITTTTSLSNLVAAFFFFFLLSFYFFLS